MGTRFSTASREDRFAQQRTPPRAAAAQQEWTDPNETNRSLYFFRVFQALAAHVGKGDDKLSKTETDVMIQYLAHCDGRTGSTFVSVGQIAETLRIHRRGVELATTELTRKGWLATVKVGIGDRRATRRVCTPQIRSAEEAEPDLFTESQGVPVQQTGTGAADRYVPVQQTGTVPVQQTGTVPVQQTGTVPVQQTGTPPENAPEHNNERACAGAPAHAPAGAKQQIVIRSVTDQTTTGDARASGPSPSVPGAAAPVVAVVVASLVQMLHAEGFDAQTAADLAQHPRCTPDQLQACIAASKKPGVDNPLGYIRDCVRFGWRVKRARRNPAAAPAPSRQPEHVQEQRAARQQADAERDAREARILRELAALDAIALDALTTRILDAMPDSPARTVLLRSRSNPLASPLWRAQLYQTLHPQERSHP